MSEMVDRVADAMTEEFKSIVTEHAGIPFHETGVELPRRDVWVRYARAAIAPMIDEALK